MEKCIFYISLTAIYLCVILTYKEKSKQMIYDNMIYNISATVKTILGLQNKFTRQQIQHLLSI